MSDTGTPPTIPIEFQQYNSYVEDPKYQRTFSIIWASSAGLAILLAVPNLILSIRRKRAFVGVTGIWEDWSGSARHYEPVTSTSEEKVTRTVSHPEPGVVHVRKRPWRVAAAALVKSVGAVAYWTPPGIGLNAGQIFLISAYLVTVLVCIIHNAPLIDNPNRAGFLALAQLPPVFLFATKTSPLSLLLSPLLPPYEKLNYIHRWTSRILFLSATIHGSLWIRNHLEFGLAILDNKKEQTGVVAFGLLCVIVLSSLRIVRRCWYQVFWTIHILAFPAFFITICYHTIYAPPWIYPPLAFYGLDILLRLFRFRIKDASLTPIDNQMTIIRVADCDGGWHAAQHILLRVFFSGRVFESHPLTIMSAPKSTSCLSSPGLLLGARVNGDWTRLLNEYALKEKDALCCSSEKSAMEMGVQVQVMLDGAYGGCSIDLGMYETVLLVAGGSGATFTIGLLDDVVGRCVRLGRKDGEVTRRIEFVWCIKSFGSIEWFATQLMDIATIAAQAGSSIDLHLSIYVTCLCDPDAIPDIPNLDVTIERPSVSAILHRLTTSDEEDAGKGKGGVAVCASGPHDMMREVRNAVARVAVGRGGEVGGVALHTELFSL